MNSIGSIDNGEFWSSIASKYDRNSKRLGGDPIYQNIRPRIESAVRGKAKVLDLATGTGTVAVWMAPFVGSVNAVDIAEGMICAAKQKVAAQGMSNVRLDVMQSYQLEFPDETFEVVTCVNALHVMSHPVEALLEMKRVTKVGGRLILPTYCHGQTLVSQVLSRVLALVGLRARTRYSQRSFRMQVEALGLQIEVSEMISGIFPLAYLQAVRAS
jgi:ubiquinone/menaquinone biosynthesis C-methylase UbiE